MRHIDHKSGFLTAVDRDLEIGRPWARSYERLLFVARN